MAAEKKTNNTEVTKVEFRQPEKSGTDLHPEIKGSQETIRESLEAQLGGAKILNFPKQPKLPGAEKTTEKANYIECDNIEEANQLAYRMVFSKNPRISALKFLQNNQDNLGEKYGIILKIKEKEPDTILITPKNPDSNALINFVKNEPLPESALKFYKKVSREEYLKLTAEEEQKRKKKIKTAPLGKPGEDDFLTIHTENPPKK